MQNDQFFYFSLISDSDPIGMLSDPRELEATSRIKNIFKKDVSNLISNDDFNIFLRLNIS